jgi:hypothetical protein
MTGEVVPFGKYKGQPAEVLLADASYRDWLLAQPWFSQRYVNLYQTVINYGGPPADTPEHNQMQASFLDNERCLRLAKLLWPKRRQDAAWITEPPEFAEVRLRFRGHLATELYDAPVVDRQFEDRGWDVVFRVEAPAVAIRAVSLPACTCGPCDHTQCGPDARCHGGIEDRWVCHHWGHDKRTVPTPDTGEGWYWPGGCSYHCWSSCPWGDQKAAQFLLTEHEFGPDWRNMVRVELKPDLGDDFPAVLRQVCGYHHDYGDRRCVIVRRAEFAQVTWEQVRAMFEASGIALLSESDLDGERPEVGSHDSNREGAHQ